MNAARGDRFVPILLSVLIHALIVGALVWGWWRYRTPKPTPQTLAIEATVVHTAPKPTPPAPPAPVPPQQDAAAQAQKAREAAQAAADKAAAEKAAADKAAAEKAEADKAAAEKVAADKAAAEKAAADKAAAEKAAADKAAAEKAEAERVAAAKAEAERKAKEAAERKAKEQLAQERAQSEADLRSQLAAEEHLNAVESSPAKAEYLALITARINRAWIRPPSAHAGIKCVVHITQVAGGEITHVSVEGCNGDEAVRQSVQTAAYRASPLPAPADAALFDPNITVTFAPDE
jgi:colicin import membrane protein